MARQILYSYIDIIMIGLLIGLRIRYGQDSYASIQLRRDAAIKLDNPELVMMLAMARNDVCLALVSHPKNAREYLF